MKDWHLCLGQNCALDGDFEDINCADPIDTANPDDPESLGEGLPGCDIKDVCDDGSFPPCDDVVPTEGEGSVEVETTFPDLDPSDLIP